MKYITEFWGDNVKKTTTPENIQVLKNLMRHMKKHYNDDTYSARNIGLRWVTEENTGFYLRTDGYFRSHQQICLKVDRLPEFEEQIAGARGYIDERKPTKKQRENAICLMSPSDNIGGFGNNDVCVMVGAVADVDLGELIPIAIPADLDAYEKTIENEKSYQRELAYQKIQEKENKRRSQPMTITVGMWEDLLRRVKQLEDYND